MKRSFEQYKQLYFQNPQEVGALKHACAALVHLPGLINRELPWIEKQSEGWFAPDLQRNIGKCFLRVNRPAKALEYFKKAGALVEMGIALKALGQHREAWRVYQDALERNPDDLDAAGQACFLAQLMDGTPRDRLDAARRYSEILRRRVKPLPPVGLPEPPPLVVGFVSGDLYRHPAAYFLLGLLENLDRKKVRVIVFKTQLNTDDYTGLVKSACDEFVDIFGMKDLEAARLIRRIGVHILFDLSGHTAYNRLPLFALKPAPVQASWLGYFASTGVPGMDYLLVDKQGALPEYAQECTEKLIYLPETRLCFTPPGNAPEIRPKEAVVAPVFGSFAQLSKITPEVLALWAGIMEKAPEARLRIQSRAFKDSGVRERFVKGSGLPGNRLMLFGASSYSGYLDAYGEIDLILDTFPYPGGTTTCEALWMGVPTLTLAGKTLLSRQGAAIMSAAGYPEWIAQTREEYVLKAVNSAECRKPREDIRPYLLNTPLFNTRMFAVDFEGVVEEMWRLHMPRITIDGKEFHTENLSEEARRNLGAIQFVDRRMAELKAEISALQTARNAYAGALYEMLNKDDAQ